MTRRDRASQATSKGNSADASRFRANLTARPPSLAGFRVAIGGLLEAVARRNSTAHEIERQEENTEHHRLVHMRSFVVAESVQCATRKAQAETFGVTAACVIERRMRTQHHV